MNGWLIAIVVIGVLNIGINLAKHGQNKSDEKYSFYGAAIGFLIQLFLIYKAIETGL